jgi:hypothetical protein
MNRSCEYSSVVRGALEHPTRGVVGLVDDLLNLCREHALELDWQADRCRIRSDGGAWEELHGLTVRKSVFRAILARFAVLCNERIPNSVSPYGGQGEVALGSSPQGILKVAFVNTPTEQKLEMMADNEPRADNSKQHIPPEAANPEMLK